MPGSMGAVAAANGNRSKDAEGLTCVAKAFKLMMAGTDVLDALIAGVNIVELDPEDITIKSIRQFIETGQP